MQKNGSGEKESKVAECGLPFDGEGKYAGLSITERISDTIAVQYYSVFGIILIIPIPDLFRFYHRKQLQPTYFSK